MNKLDRLNKKKNMTSRITENEKRGPSLTEKRIDGKRYMRRRYKLETLKGGGLKLVNM